MWNNPPEAGTTTFPDIYRLVEMRQVLDLLAETCQGHAAKSAALELPLYRDIETVKRLLLEAHEARLGVDKNDLMPIRPLENLSRIYPVLAIEGYVLSLDELRNIHALVLNAKLLMHYFSTRKETYLTLYEVVRQLPWDETPYQLIGRVLNEHGEVRPDASPELQKIRARVQSKQRELDGVFRQVLAKYRNSGFLTDTAESTRNGRRVLTVPSEHKRSVRGILHDESATGRTAFIEPEETIGLNNDVMELEVEEQREIFRILKDLSAALAVHIPGFKAWEKAVAYLDLALARGRLARTMNGRMPRLLDRPSLGIVEGQHPLLLLRLKGEKKKVVPFDLVLFENNRILVISGPNAGGKSVTMKAIGLMQIMVQSGLLVPVQENSEFGLFKSFFADIGDSQSLLDDLSTYSSRLLLMKHTLENADADSLVLIDEFGSGTDPQIGGAIAEAILQQLHKQKAMGIVTTHYANIKIFAYKTPGIVNASMFFDRAHLKPTFELKVGRPGSSYAFEIADKIGLPQHVIKNVRERLGKTDQAVEHLLVDLQQEKKEVEEKLAELKGKDETLQKLMKSYQELQRDTERQRKQIALDSVRQAKEVAIKQNQEIERVVREIREGQNLEAAREKAEEARRNKAKLEAEAIALDSQLEQLEKKATTADGSLSGQPEWFVGQTVSLRNASSKGIIRSIDKKSATVEVGGLTFEARLRDLIPVAAPIKSNYSGVTIDMVERNSKFDPVLELRGILPSDGIKLIETFMDEAMMYGIHSVRIIHGKGTGAMRTLVKNTLKQYGSMFKASHPEDSEGGNGVTIVQIA
jgi:DNA mismatch repair protein MutS2